MKTNHLTTKLVLALSLVLFTALSGFAQGTAKPQLLRIQVIHVKPDMVNQYMEFIKNETLPMLQKGGAKQRAFWRSAGPVGDGTEFIIAQPIDNLAELDEPDILTKVFSQEGVQAYVAKRAQMLVSRKTFIIRSLPDAEITPKQDGTPKLAVMRRSSIAPGRQADYDSYLKNDVLPILKKSGLKGHLVAKVVIGGDPNEYLTYDFYDSFTDYEKSREVVTKNEGYSKMVAKQAGMVMHTELEVFRFVPELSLMPAPAKAASK